MSVSSQKPAEGNQGANRRATVRYRRNTPQAGRAFIANSSVAVPALVVDISRGGIGLILESRVEPDTLVRIEMDDDGKQVLAELVANVAHISAMENGRWRCGCEWVQPLTEEELQVLKGRP